MLQTSEQQTIARPHILCVDDEPHVLEGMAVHLRRRFVVKTAVSGNDGLQLLADDKAIVAVVSDMRMPGLDGAAFLQKVRVATPDVVRMLLTGQADLPVAVAAVNEGQIFRFLPKPCPPPALLAAIEAAVAQHRLITAERLLIERTINGSIKLLAEVLELTNPVSFARAKRIKELVVGTAEKLHLEDRWQLEAAALLSQIGWTTPRRRS
jgi:DNA-binding NtrC family response regulator